MRVQGNIIYSEFDVTNTCQCTDHDKLKVCNRRGIGGFVGETQRGFSVLSVSPQFSSVVNQLKVVIWLPRISLGQAGILYLTRANLTSQI